MHTNLGVDTLWPRVQKQPVKVFTQPAKFEEITSHKITVSKSWNSCTTSPLSVFESFKKELNTVGFKDTDFDIKASVVYVFQFFLSLSLMRWVKNQKKNQKLN